MPKLESQTTSKAEISLTVEHELSAHVASPFYPPKKESLIINIRSTKPRCLASARFLYAVDVAEDPSSSGVSLNITASDTPLFGSRPFDTLKCVPQKRLPIGRCGLLTPLKLAQRLTNSVMQRPFVSRVRPRRTPTAAAEPDVSAANTETPLIPRPLRLPLRHYSTIKALLDVRRRSIPLRPGARSQPRVVSKRFIERHQPRALVHSPPRVHLPRHTNTCIKEFGRWLNAKAAALLGFKECNRLQRSEMGPTLVQRIPNVRVTYPSPVFARRLVALEETGNKHEGFAEVPLTAS